ncbi:MAG: tetratricopeptide repeat protein [Candidatus Gygaella obscura]|nr:tetratricopeptide repeat protein [Candidatus Gygaella obscura]
MRRKLPFVFALLFSISFLNCSFVKAEYSLIGEEGLIWKKSVDGIKDAVRDLLAENKNLKQQIDLRSLEMHKLNEVLKALQDKNDTLEKKIESMDLKVTLNSKVKSLTRRNESLKGLKGSLEVEVKQLRANNIKLKKDSDVLEKEVSSLGKRFEITQTQLEELKDSYINFKQKSVDYEKELEGKLINLQSENKRSSGAIQDNEKLAVQLRDLKEEKIDLLSQLKTTKEQFKNIDSLSQKIVDLQNEKQRLSDSLENSRIEIEELKKTLEEKDNFIDSNKNELKKIELLSNELSKAEKEKLGFKDEIVSLKIQLNESNNKLEISEKEIEVLSESFNKFKQKSIENQEKLIETQKENTNLGSRIAPLKNQLDNLQEKLVILEKEKDLALRKSVVVNDADKAKKVKRIPVYLKEQVEDKSSTIPKVIKLRAFQQAEKKLNSLQKLDLGIIEVMLSNAYNYANNNQISLASREYRKVLDLDSKNKDALFNLGVVYLNNHNVKHAIANFEKLVELDPNDAQALYNLALCYSKMHNKKQTEFYYLKYLELENDS